ncbi:MAG: Gfo/Idh/MocA family oxidoreductase [Kiritimatiellae bacterium]|nr:Gfo/Idh/MocA family oxidoreductase [Kiritimatiellia bacterium]
MKRRAFLKQAGGIALFNVLPRRLLAGSGETPPSETVRVAAIGCAGRPVADINGLADNGAEIVGLCDVDTRRIGATRKRYPKAPFFTDYREMLDKLDASIDAVIVGTPDHSHATIAIDCLKRGKHVQCEKPLAQTFGEVDEMVRAAKAAGKVNQAMNQGHAYPTLRDFREWVEAGIIGQVTEAHIWAPAVYSCMDQLGELKKQHEIPKELNWELWQNRVDPHRPYCPLYLPGRWRFWTDFGCSTLGDWSCHLMDPIFWTLDLGLPTAVTAEVIGTWDPLVHGATYPKGAKTTLEFKLKNGKPFKIVWFDGEGTKQIPLPSSYTADGGTLEGLLKRTPAVENMSEGSFVYGDKGVLQYGHHGAIYLRALPESHMKELRESNALPPQKYRRVPNGSPFREFLDAVKGGEPVGSDFAYAGNITQASLMAIAALFDPGKRLIWDPKKRCFENSAAANKRLYVKRLEKF